MAAGTSILALPPNGIFDLFNFSQGNSGHKSKVTLELEGSGWT